MVGRQTRRRQRSKMKRIENEDGRLISFLERKFGILKKASELVTLYRAEVGVVAISSTGAPFSFAHPNIVANKFLNRNLSSNDRSHFLEVLSSSSDTELNQQHEELVNQIKIEKVRGVVLERLIEGKSHGAWSEAPTEELNLKELNQMKAQMENLWKSLWRSIH